LDEAGEILRSIKHEEYLQGVPLLVVANKQDLPNAISPDELAEKLELADVFGQSRLWHVVPAITTDKADDGWKAGMKWLTDAVKQYKTGLVAQEEEAAAMKKLAAKSASLVNTVATKTAATTTAGATPAIAA
jgi:signal recognition particle receptor subunit beta